MKSNRSIVTKFALIIFIIFFFSPAIQAGDMGTLDTSPGHVEKIQNFIDKLIKENQRIKEINVHATGTDGDTKLIASTTPGKAGSPSDPEDIDAIIDNNVVVIDEDDVLDVTIPMANKEGIPAAVAGIRILKGGENDDSVKDKAIGIAKQIDEILVTQ